MHRRCGGDAAQCHRQTHAVFHFVPAEPELDSDEQRSRRREEPNATTQEGEVILQGQTESLMLTARFGGLVC